MRRSAVVLLTLLAAIVCTPAHAERIKDLAAVAGVRSNQLVGYGLVVGLDGSGDQSSQAPFTTQSMKNMLAQFGVVLPPGTNPQLKNVAAVSVHAELLPFAKPGQPLDITVSSIGNAASLRGGTLLMTPLKGPDGKIYAIAQGNLVVGGLGVSTEDGSKLSVNIPSAGRIPGGAIVERAVPMTVGGEDSLVLNLHRADFTTATRVAQAINRALGDGTALPLDSTSIRVSAPRDLAQRVGYVATLEALTVDPGDAPARVIINARTGTVVISQNVRVQPAAVSHGTLTVTIASRPMVSQPAPLSTGETVVVRTTEITAQERADQRMFLFDAGVSLDEIVRAVNNVGASPGDLVAILEALREAGALRAELVII